MTPGRPRRLPDEVRPPFSWIGGALCLDFVNTVSWRAPGVLENERFRGAADLADWGVVARLHDEATALNEQTVALAHELRHGLHELLLHTARQELPSDDDVEWLNAWIRRCSDHVRVVPSTCSASWTWVADRAVPAFDPGLALLGLVTLSAVDLLRSSDRSLLRVCANDRCGWLFVDRSRKHNRRWCEMRECGGRAKARRYQSRRRAAPGESMTPPE
jgi:predicted RNA-binding Zn ribbon-like protein